MKEKIELILDCVILGQKTHKEATSELCILFDVIHRNLQLCPKCNGQGIISKPPWIAGDVNIWISTQVSFTCDVCGGAKVI